MRIVTSLLIASVLLTACSGEEKSRYRDTAELEKPPVLAPNLDAPDEEGETSAVKEKDRDGIGDDVYLTTGSPQQLKIKRPLKQAWKLVGLALIRSGITITDRDSEKGTYTVKYDADSFSDEDANFLENIAVFGNDYEESAYVLSLKEEGAEVVVNAALDPSDGQKGAERDDAPSATDGDQILLKSLHKTLRNDLKLEQ